MESKSISAYLFEENTNSGNVSNLISPPSASGASVCACTHVPLLWLCAGRDEHGGAWCHAGFPILWLQQPSQPRGHSEWKVWRTARHTTEIIKYTTLNTWIISCRSCFCAQGATLSMAPPQCSQTWLARIYTSLICHQLKLVRDFKNLISEFGVTFRKYLKHPRLCAAVF